MLPHNHQRPGIREAHRKPSAALAPRVISISFMGIIALGALLLMLPLSSRSGQATPFIDALFTATSATCVTGLVVYDTYQHWSVFGRIVILCLIQIGGLGLVTFTTFFNLIIGKKLGLRGMRIASESINSDTIAELPKMISLVVTTSLAVETLGAFLLCFSFVPRLGMAEGIGTSVFLAISAFCNAGFDPLGHSQAYISLCEFNGSPLVLFPIMALIIIGGLGFVVWSDLLAWRQYKRLTLHSRLVLVMTGILILSGTAVFLCLEWNNPKTFGALPPLERVHAALFQSVTCRTAGFNSVDVASLTGASKAFSLFLMFIGAAPGSTAGGIKITTLAVVVMTVVGVVRGREDTVILHRKTPKTVVYKALAVMLLSITLVGVATAIISYDLKDSGASGIDILFEAVSAFATVGLSSGITGISGLPARIILILTMFIGRIGPVTFVLSMAMRPSSKRHEVMPEAKIFL